MPAMPVTTRSRTTAHERVKRPLEDAVPEDSSLCVSSPAVQHRDKRPRYKPKASEENDSRQRAARLIVRAGVPTATSTSAFVLPDKPSPPYRGDDKDGHYIYEVGENLTSRFKILSKMGEGTFGRVLECWDRKLQKYVAIKIVKNVEKYRHAALIELEVLNTLAQNDPFGDRHCVQLQEWFDYRGHVCMVFEKLGPSLYDFLRKNNFHPFPLHMVQSFTRQLLESVAYLHELALVHTDLKPENILLLNDDTVRVMSSQHARISRRLPGSSRIKVIDFGSATWEDQHHSAIVSTRHYRAPEVILGLGWSYACDVWSIGCIIVELLTGDALFQTHENLEHLAMMERVLGPMPGTMVRSACRVGAGKYFLKGSLAWPGDANSKSIRTVRRMPELRDAVLDASEAGGSSAGLVDVLDLLQRMLRYDPAERISAMEALEHPFLSTPIVQVPYQLDEVE